MNRSTLSPDSPYLVVREEEPDGRGGRVETTAIFLTASTCPIGCSMCDLHHHTLGGPTPPGAIPRQIQRVLADSPGSGWLKLYNSGNFFDPRSIPPDDYSEIARLCGGFSRVVVENHPKFGSDRLRRLVDLLEPPLEVAVGLETVQPRWLRRMGKQMSRDDFDRYAHWLADQGVSLRVFLIVGVPGIGVDESIRWARLSVRHAIARGARHVSLIPARSGEGWNGQANQLPNFTLDDLVRLQQKAIEDVQGRAAVTVDLWDLEKNLEEESVGEANSCPLTPALSPESLAAESNEIENHARQRFGGERAREEGTRDRKTLLDTLRRVNLTQRGNGVVA